MPTRIPPASSIRVTVPPPTGSRRKLTETGGNVASLCPRRSTSRPSRSMRESPLRRVTVVVCGGNPSTPQLSTLRPNSGTRSAGFSGRRPGSGKRKLASSDASTGRRFRKNSSSQFRTVMSESAMPGTRNRKFEPAARKGVAGSSFPKNDGTPLARGMSTPSVPVSAILARPVPPGASPRKMSSAS